MGTWFSGFSFTDPNSASFIPSGTHLFPIQRQLSGVKNMTRTLLFWKNYTQTYGWWFVRNPVNSPVEVGSLSHFMRFYTSQVVVWDFWTINSTMYFLVTDRLPKFPPKRLAAEKPWLLQLRWTTQLWAQLRAGPRVTCSWRTQGKETKQTQHNT